MSIDADVLSVMSRMLSMGDAPFNRHRAAEVLGPGAGIGK